MLGVVTDTQSDSPLGKLLGGRYLATSVLDRARSLPTFLATDKRLNKEVELRIISSHGDAALLERIRVRAERSAKFTHQNIMTLEDLGSDGRWIYVVTEHLPIRTLRTVTQGNGALNAAYALAICDSVLEGLAALHTAGYVHSRLSPEYVFLSEDGIVRLDGFEFLSEIGAGEEDTLVGEVSYLAPELVLGKNPDARSDIYAVGVMLYEMLTGQPPFSGDVPIQVAYQSVNSTVPRPSALALGIPDDLDELVLWATANDPDARPHDATALLQELRYVRAHLSTKSAVSEIGLHSRHIFTQQLGSESNGGDRTEPMSWLPDGPAHVDMLRRRPLASALAARLSKMSDLSPGETFLLHVDGPWGAGKSTVLSYLRNEVEEKFLPITFNAWRESRIGPPWWSLLTSIRSSLANQLSPSKRLRFRWSESINRLQRIGAPLVFALCLFVLLATTLIILFKQDDLTLSNAGDVAGTITAVIAVAGTVWMGALVAGRFVLWDSARGAKIFEQSSSNPMHEVAKHFSWLAYKAEKPIIFFIDDLDRCDHTYVVELLEAVQTLLKESPQTSIGNSVRPTVYFVIAADGAWIRASYEAVYDKFLNAVAEPGRPLGYLFLDKLFQLRVTIPLVDANQGDLYLRNLLQSVGTSEISLRRLAKEEDVIRTHIDGSSTESDIMEVYRSASADVRSRVSGDVVEKLNSSQAEAETGLKLQRFSSLLSSNPRSVKRFINAYAIQRAISVLAGNYVSSDTLALWVILEMRWPALADFLRQNPHAVGPDASIDSYPEELAMVNSLMLSEPVREVLTFKLGGPLTPELIRACCGDS
jgi:serine/threonine protein kinase